MKPETIIFNAKALVSVKIFDKDKNDNWDWKKAYSYLYIIRDKAGWEHISRLYNKRFSDEELLKEHPEFMIENGWIYYRPYVQLRFTNSESYIKRFDTLAEAFKWSRKQVKKEISIKLEFNGE